MNKSIVLLFAIMMSFDIYADSCNLVEITEKDNVMLDIRYATKNNFTNQKLYKFKKTLIHKDAYKKLKVAIEYADRLGLKIKIFDAFRPLDVQEELYKRIADENYVSDPKTGVATHTRGVALDVTLVDKKTKKDLYMGTEFDSFEEKAHHGPKADIQKQILQNRITLAGIMAVSGFTPLPTEWWHYNLRIYDVYPDYKDYPKLKAKQVDLK